MPAFINNIQRADITRLAEEVSEAIFLMAESNKLRLFSSSLSVKLFDDTSPLSLMQERLVREVIAVTEKNQNILLDPSSVRDVVQLTIDSDYRVSFNKAAPVMFYKLVFDYQSVLRAFWRQLVLWRVRGCFNKAAPKKNKVGGTVERSFNYEFSRLNIEDAMNSKASSSEFLARTYALLTECLEEILVARGSGSILRCSLSVSEETVTFSATVVDADEGQKLVSKSEVSVN